MGPIVTGGGTEKGAAIHGVSYGGRAPISGQRVYLLEATTTGYINHYAQSTLGSGFSSPFGVAVDGNGNVYVGDSGNNAVKELTAASGYTTATTLGGGFSGIRSVAVDASGNVYVADSSNNAVKKIPIGCITGANNSGCVVTLGGGFNVPQGVAVDASGNVFVGDTSNSAVKEIPIGCITGANNSGCVLTLGSGFGQPHGVAVDASGNVFVGDHGHGVVYEILKAGGYTTVNTLGSGFNGPVGVGVDASGNVYVADIGSSVVKEILKAGGYTTVNTLASGLNGPWGMAVDGYGNFYVTNSGANQVSKETVSYTHQPSKSLLTTGVGSDSIGTYVLSDSLGNWSIGGDYTCDANAQAYIYALGGDSGSGTNTGAALMAVLGQCPSSGPFNFAAADPFVLMNEVTTVAAAYAMAGYASDATHVSSNNTTLGIQGMSNAFANANNLASIANGTANSSLPNNSSAVVPLKEINTLANILAACVNSTTGSANCSTLFSSAQLNGTTGGQPTDTASAVINIAHNAGTVNMTNLYGLQAGTGAPYPSDLTAQPNDFTVGISFNGNGITGPQTVAIDGFGNVWVTGGSGLSVFTPAGGVFGNFDHNSLLGLAMDTGGNAWVAGYADTSISEITASGGTGAGYSGSLSFPVAVAIDTLSNVWVANCGSSICASGGSISELTSGGGSTFTGGGLSSPSGVAIDTGGNVWASGYASGVTEFNSSGGVITSSAITAGGINGAFGIAIDAGNNLWVPDFNSNAISAVTSGGAAKGTSPFTGGGLNEPIGIAIDGSGNVWASNSNVSSVSEFSNAGVALSPSSGLGSAFFTQASDSDSSVAIDGSGNVWTVDTTNGLLIELVGAATPVVTPVVANLLSPYGGAAVNVP